MKRSLLALLAAAFSLSALAAAPESGWYFNPAESGRGFNIEIQGTTLFIAGFLYDAAGHPIWFVSGGPMSSASSYSGAAYKSDNGQPLGGSYRSPTAVPFGNVSITFPTTVDANINVNDVNFNVTREIFGAAPVAATPEGLWVGSTSASETIVGIVLDNSMFYFLYTYPGTTTIAGVVQGSGIGGNGQITSTNAKDFVLGYGVLNATVIGTYTARSSMTGQFSSSLGIQAFSAVYDVSYETPASLAAAAGAYSGTVASSAGYQSATFTVSSSGAITGAVPGCSFIGHASVHGNVNAFDLSMTFSGGTCVFGTSTLTGIAYYDAPHRTVYAAAPNAARTDGFVVVGAK